MESNKHQDTTFYLVIKPLFYVVNIIIPCSCSSPSWPRWSTTCPPSQCRVPERVRKGEMAASLSTRSPDHQITRSPDHQITRSPDHPIQDKGAPASLQPQSKSCEFKRNPACLEHGVRTGHLHHGAEPVGRAPSQAPPCPALGDDGRVWPRLLAMTSHACVFSLWRGANVGRRSSEPQQRLKDEIAEVTSEIETLGLTEERKSMQRNKQMAIGRKKFNMDPKKGIRFLIDTSLLKSTSDEIAKFLYKGEGLNKTAIGEYLGERDDFNIAVLHAFLELHEFTDLNLVQALRQFLWSFRLPGEAQKIDRMMEAFAQRYCRCNPGVFQSTDTCYVLSFAVIMLNTSLHNPNVKDKPSVQRFTAMNRGINDGGDLPEDLLRNLYDSIKNEPFKIPEDDGNDLTHTFFNPDREGWLLKLGGRVKTWKRRWFILTDNCLYYFEYTTDKEPRGIIPLENLSIREVEDSKKPGGGSAPPSGLTRGSVPLQNCFELFIPDHKDQVIKACKTEADGRVVEGNHTFYRISAPTAEEKDEWISSIKAAISRDPFYEMLASRKKKVSSLKAL
ncbi:SEC7 and coiled-coil domain-containing protein 1 [Takifugu flavidus]|uniref:SEC7 and coiled-coil domain-containing protein 1 n=1 Tax=Takifugu flavidus TaxID=433684 RepID=A0A5C6MD84_9TELE|nr:SEC7 and coiled-coil domain-containing protein 1 [Takifugu flavidus]